MIWVICYKTIERLNMPDEWQKDRYMIENSLASVFLMSKEQQKLYSTENKGGLSIREEMSFAG